MCNYSICDRLATIKGLCFAHYQQQLRGEELRSIRPRKISEHSKPCEMPQCDVMVVRSKYCKPHAATVRKYNLSDEEVQNLFDPYECAICHKSDELLHIDHDHNCCPGITSCGKCVRGVLCRDCNTRLAVVEDVKWTNQAFAYLGLDT